MRMTNLSANVNMRFKGSVKTGGGGKQAEETDETADEDVDLASIEDPVVPPIGDRLEMDEGLSGGLDVPWNFSATLSYTDNRYNPNNPSKKIWARTQLEFNLTKNWKISYNAQWDLLEGKAVSQDFVFYRDLHCWEASIAWTPTGYNKRFYFKISVKSPMLRDIKFEKGTGLSGFTSSSISSMY